MGLNLAKFNGDVRKGICGILENNPYALLPLQQVKKLKYISLPEKAEVKIGEFRILIARSIKIFSALYIITRSSLHVTLRDNEK